MPQPPTDHDPIAQLTMTLARAQDGERMHRRPGALVASWASEQHRIMLPLGATRLVGGRKPPADIVVDDPSVSGQHFELVLEGGELRLRDLGSRNGTWVHGLRLGEIVLPLGTTFVAGRVPITLEAIAEVERPISQRGSLGEMVGTNEQMRELFALLRRLGPSGIDVLVRGETGTGKELVARALHQTSERSAGPWVVLDCSSLPAELAESEIHGHAKGAFTGAHQARAGCFEAASGGTIFIDEIGELPLEQQAKLLRVLERREVRRIGETEARPIDVRVVAATHRDLADMVFAEAFREDLYFRLAGYEVVIPPLRDRPEDIEALALAFLREFAVAGGPTEIAPEALDALAAHRWPGNIRELRNLMRVCARLGHGPRVDRAMLGMLGPAGARARTASAIAAATAEPGVPEAAHGDERRAPPLPFEQAKLEMTRRYFEELLAFAGGNVSQAARLAGLDRRQVHRWLRRLEVQE